jgi:ABC-type microcin C transport system duplicated ATPase subunit YejF
MAAFCRFQDPMTGLNPTMTIGDQIAGPVRIHLGLSRAAARKRAEEVLGLVGLPRPAERLDSYPHQVSGGLRQRVMIAMALSCEPKLLIADEPTTALDVTIQAQILRLLDELKVRLDMGMLLARERCAEQEPLPRLFGDGHLAACHFPLQPALPGEPAVVASGSQAGPGSKSPGS